MYSESNVRAGERAASSCPTYFLSNVVGDILGFKLTKSVPLMSHTSASTLATPRLIAVNSGTSRQSVFASRF